MQELSKNLQGVVPVLRKLRTTREVKGDLSFQIDKEFNRLQGELLRLKGSGVIPKKTKIYLEDLQNVAMELGIKAVCGLDFVHYQARVKACRENQKRNENANGNTPRVKT
jgi:hypothetical protein